MPDELNLEPPSKAIAYLLGYFLELSQSRQSGMTVNPILYSEIVAWSQLHRIPLTSWEIRAIKQLDLYWLAIQAEE